MNYAAYTAIAAVFLFLFAAFYNGLTIRYYQVKSKKIKAPLRILQISDLHSSRYGKGQRKLISAISRLKPDIICLTGDIFDERISNENAGVLMHAISGYSVYFVMGNHELYMENLSSVIRLLDENNICILDGNAVRLNGYGISVCGVSDPINEELGHAAQTFESRLDSARADCGDGDFTILLSHRPERIRQYRERGFDLVLSGHAHGGQWRLPPLINGLWAPHQGLFPKYAGGIYKYQCLTHIVCRGLSKYLIIPRIFNPVELCVIDLSEK